MMQEANNNSTAQARTTSSSIGEEFQTNGFVGPIAVLTPEEAREALREVAHELDLDLLARNHDRGSSSSIGDGDNDGDGDGDGDGDDDDDDDDDGCTSSSATTIESKTTTTTKTELKTSKLDSKTEAESSESNHKDSTNSTNNTNRFKLHLVLPTLDRIAHHPRIIAAVRACLPPTNNLVLWSSDINLKLADQSGRYFAPHQDATYAGLQPPMHCVTVWLALSDPVGRKDGCLSFYAQPLAQMEQLPHTVSKNCDASNPNKNMLSLGQYIAQDIIRTTVKLSKKSDRNNANQGVVEDDPNDTAIAIPLRGGQMTIHSFYTIHYSGPNTSKHRPRVGLALRYIDGNTVIQTKGRMKEMVTAIDRQTTATTKTNWNNDTFEYEPRLPTAPTPDDRKRMEYIRQEAMERENTNYFSSQQ